MVLDSKYFEILAYEDVADVGYYIVRPEGNPMILYSNVDGSPLAALELKCTSKHGKSLITKRYSGDTDFQGLINEDKQEFMFIITNLTGYGMINFNIMHNDSKVVDVDPRAEKGGVNQVNEIHPYQSYEIKCDQKDNLTFILDSIKTDSGHKLTVAEAEAKSQPEGTKFYLSVVPEADNTDLIRKFTETFWTCSDVLCVEDITSKNSITKGYSSDVLYVEDITSKNYITKGYSTSAQDDRSPNMPVQHMSFSIPHYFDTPPDSRDFGMSERSPSAKDIIKESQLSFGCSKQLLVDDFANCKIYTGIPSYKNKNMDVVIDNSTAAKLGKGRHIDVRSKKTDNKYEFDYHSVKCTLGLSICENLQFMKPSPVEELKRVAGAMMKDILESKHQQYRDQLTKLYESEQCVICLEDNSAPDTIFYSCGHKCCHMNCAETLKNCPFCRLHITAKLIC